MVACSNGQQGAFIPPNFRFKCYIAKFTIFKNMLLFTSPYPVKNATCTLSSTEKNSADTHVQGTDHN